MSPREQMRQMYPEHRFDFLDFNIQEWDRINYLATHIIWDAINDSTLTNREIAKQLRKARLCVSKNPVATHKSKTIAKKAIGRVIKELGQGKILFDYEYEELLILVSETEDGVENLTLFYSYTDCFEDDSDITDYLGTTYSGASKIIKVDTIKQLQDAWKFKQDEFRTESSTY